MSIVSTKIPFKGAGKEYIGDDIEEMVAAVKHAIQACGLQVRGGLSGANLPPKVLLWTTEMYKLCSLHAYLGQSNKLPDPDVTS